MSIIPAIIAYLLAISTAALGARLLGAPPTSGRFAAVDGLRGYLATGVFIHHGAVWYFFLRTGEWKVPPSFVYTNLGQASVVLFFMVTGFLFSTKLLHGRSEPLNWYKLYLSRVFRLVPLYVLAVTLIACTIAAAAQFHLQESPYALSKNLAKLGMFTALGPPKVVGFETTFLAVGGVTWTLSYEWLFYFTLPLVAVSVRVITPRRFLIGAVLLLGVMIYRMQPELIYFAAFGGGIIAAVLVRFASFRRVLRGSAASFVALAGIATEVTCFPTAYHLLPIVLLTIAFIVIAGENTLFGLLAMPASRFLGQLTYSIYLLHSILLFWIFRFGIRFERAATYSLLRHWLVIWLCIPVLFAICYATFRWIELPGMRSVSHLSRWFFDQEHDRTTTQIDGKSARLRS